MNGSSSGCRDPLRRREDGVLSPTDRISQLPGPVLHHILSFLRTKDVVRTGILSKTWYHTSTSFAISDFSQSMVGSPRRGTTMEELIHIFVEFVHKSLQSQCRIYGTITNFALSMIEHSPHTSIIEDCIQLAIQNNVKHLQIKIMRNKARLIMPQTLLSAKELLLLRLSECHLYLPPTHGVPNWPFLRKLRLESCHLDGQIFQNLAFSCPVLKSLFLLYCDELRDISLSGLTKLTQFEIARSAADTHDIKVELDVQCLKTFALYCVRGRCNVDLSACKNITILKWNHFPPMLSSRDLTKLIDGLPALESLELRWGSDRIRFSSQRLEKLQLTADQLVENDLPDLIDGLPALKFLSLHCKCDRIKFSSQLLEKLHLSGGELMETDLTELIAGLPSLNSLSLNCKCERIEFSSQQLEELKLPVSELVEVSIDAPNLKTFRCSESELSCDLFMGRSNPQEVYILFGCDSSSSLLQLRKFLGGFKQIKLLKLFFSERIGLLPAESMDIPLSPLLDIKRIRILSDFEAQTQSRGECVDLLNGLLRSCHPESISLTSGFSGKLMTSVFYEELSEMVKGQQCCKDDDRIQCGCHGLRSFQIKQTGGNASFISCDEFLELLPTLASKIEIHFMLEW